MTVAPGITAMADRAHRTRQKMTFRLATTKPRNPLVAPAIKRVAGPHRKTRGALRLAERQALQKSLEKKDDDA